MSKKIKEKLDVFLEAIENCEEPMKEGSFLKKIFKKTPQSKKEVNPNSLNGLKISVHRKIGQSGVVTLNIEQERYEEEFVLSNERKDDMEILKCIEELYRMLHWSSTPEQDLERSAKIRVDQKLARKDKRGFGHGDRPEVDRALDY